MSGQILGGGVIVFVAVALWLVYLLPSLQSRHHYSAAERNAVRLNQALRILAETSETPQEVRLELNARTAVAQQKLARRAQSERADAELLQAKAELELARAERAAARERTRSERAQAHRHPAARRARARRRARVLATTVALAALALGVWGGFALVATGSTGLLWAAGGMLAAAILVLRQMSRVAAHARPAAAPSAPARTAAVQDLALPASPAGNAWQPRPLPKPLGSSAGSRAAAVLDAEQARDQLRHAALEQIKRDRAAAQAPPSIADARPAAREDKRETVATAPASPYARMGYVDDAEIESHVRDLLSRRAAG